MRRPLSITMAGLVALLCLVGCVGGVKNRHATVLAQDPYQVVQFAPDDPPFTAFPSGAMTIYNQTICNQCPKGLVVCVYIGDQVLCEKVKPGSGFMFASPAEAFTLRFVARDEAGRELAYSFKVPSVSGAPGWYRPSIPVRYDSFQVS